MASYDTNRTGFAGAPTTSFFANLRGTMARWNDERATRRVLRSLSERELEDIGLTRGDIDTIAAAGRRA